MKKQLLLLCVIFIPLVACADPVEIDGINYILYTDVNEAEIVAKNSKYSGDVIIPESVKIEDAVYYVTSINKTAFHNCNELISLSIPKTIRDIEQYFLSGCINLESLAFNCDTIKNWVGSVIGKQIKKVTLDNNVKVIGEKAFSGFKALHTIEIGSNLKKIENKAFEYCTIYTVNICNLKSWCEIECVGASSHPLLDKYYIRKKLLLNGEEITDLVLDDNITQIRNCAFACSSIKSVTFNTNLISISGGAFGHCGLLSSVYTPDIHTWLNITFGGPESNPLNNGAHLYINQKEENYLTIPNDIKYIKNYAFVGYKELLSITIPSEVTTICNGAFYNCENLKEVYLNEGLISIGEYAFYQCEKLSSISIPNSVSSIGANSFSGCKKLCSISIPDMVSSVEASTFSMCNNLKDVHLGKGIVSIDESAFFRCAINFIDIPDNVTTIAPGAFDNCFTLHCVVLRRGIKEIGEKAFSYNNIYSLFCYSDIIPTIHEYAFKNAELGTLFVPDNLIDEYKQKAAWRDFEYYNTLPKITYIVDDEKYKSCIIKYGETIVAEEAPIKEGYTFSGWSDIPETMPAYDVIVTGKFIVNKYKLTYKVDGEEYKTLAVEYGTAIVAEEEPTKEGYTFSGWSEIPETMPAKDVVITGTFTINSYTITYKIDGEVFKTESVEYGSPITTPEAPAREGYTFEWMNIPETMPAYDITIDGSYTSGIDSVYTEEGGDVKWYTIDGKQKETPQKGINIMKKSNGKTQKVLMK